MPWSWGYVLVDWSSVCPQAPSSQAVGSTALGEVVVSGRIVRGRGLPIGTRRRHPAWGLTFLTAGAGRYVDAAHDEPVSAGTLILVHPHHPHWYGADDAGWDEDFVVFTGPLFELAQHRGLLTPQQPLVHGLPVARWSHRFAQFRESPTTPTALAAQAAGLLALILEAVAWSEGAARRSDTTHRRSTEWLHDSQRALQADLTESLDLAKVAGHVGMAYETWRRRFRDQVGQSPYAYRAAARLSAATELLVHTGLSIRDISAATGYSDQRHFIRRFRAVHGVTPTTYRNR